MLSFVTRKITVCLHDNNGVGNEMFYVCIFKCFMYESCQSDLRLHGSKRVKMPYYAFQGSGRRCHC